MLLGNSHFQIQILKNVSMPFDQFGTLLLYRVYQPQLLTAFTLHILPPASALELL
jgi:hypothetical protein